MTKSSDTGSRWIVVGAVLGGLAVALGAFAAHGLDRYFHKRYAGQEFQKKIELDSGDPVMTTTPLAEKYLTDFKTAAQYQMYHALALLVIGIVSRGRPSRWLNAAAWAMLAGTAGFSGGLYVYTLTGAKWIGMTVVPIGGTFFLFGWLAFALGARQNSQSSVTSN
jgi:uncharacterized membrane protein YgdD (TMEM256/DUF423 family)